MKNAAHLLPVQVNLVRPLWCDYVLQFSVICTVSSSIVQMFHFKTFL